jgi:hypothetical protein
MEPKKTNLCDKHGNCTASRMNDYTCGFYKKTSYAVCSHFGWQGSCTSAEARQAAQNNVGSDPRSRRKEK